LFMKVCAAITVIMAMLLRDFGLVGHYLWLSVFTINFAEFIRICWKVLNCAYTWVEDTFSMYCNYVIET
jgi:hypothetical protein